MSDEPLAESLAARLHPAWWLPRWGEILAAAMLTLIVGAAVMPGFLRARERGEAAAARDRMRATAAAITSYFVDHHAFPACAAAGGAERTYASQLFGEDPAQSRIPSGVTTANSFATPESGAYLLVTFRLGGPAARGPASLTTPVAYLPRLLADPFARTPGASLGYFVHGSGLGWMLTSFGPDRDENAPGGPGDINPRIERLYDLASVFPNMWLAPPDLIDLTYDPSNGLASSGDLYWVAGN